MKLFDEPVFRTERDKQVFTWLSLIIMIGFVGYQMSLISGATANDFISYVPFISIGAGVAYVLGWT
jgi:hypothetical protein